MSTVDLVRAEVERRGLRAVARDLGANPKTVAYWLAGASHDRTTALLEQKADVFVNPHVTRMREAVASGAPEERLRALFADALVAHELSGEPPYNRIPNAIQGDLWLFCGPFQTRDAAEIVIRKAVQEAVHLPAAIKELIGWWGQK